MLDGCGEPETRAINGDKPMPDDLPSMIKTYRDYHALTQEALSTRWGVPLATIRGWERGKPPAQPTMLAVLLREVMQHAA